ncbi:MAG: asparagine synthase (glutamine-hydrolyzing) [Erysipelotrichaceae bacterium]|nr:asparagine synthase (glutamine-hydrolyzing) [Erysipelotrichaceae bacterium]
MCGMGGWLDYQLDMHQKINDLKNMQRTLDSRGPDDGGIYVQEHCGLVHSHLAIVDVENGKQPFSYGNYTIVYNGELYNANEMKDELLELGYRFNTKTDTEVVLLAYIAWGVSSFKKLNGIYAFAIYNDKTEELVLVRDCFGVKPLYYYEYEQGIVFGSLIKTLFASTIVKPIVTKESLKQIFLLGPGKIPGSGVFKDVQEILPGQYMVINPYKTYHEFYYQLEAKKHTETVEETIEHIRRLVIDSIERQLPSDIEYGTMLSGGLDSSIVSKVASVHCVTLPTYYIRYQDNEKYFKQTLFQPNQDEDFVQVMVEDMESDFHTITLNEEQLFDSLYEAMKARDLPGMADIDSSFYLFCKNISELEKVVLSGECADEIFGGYPWYYNEEYMWKDTFPWMDSIEFRKRLLMDTVLDDEELFVQKLYRETINSVSYLESDSYEQRRHRELFYLNIYWFMQTLLDRCDRMSMANGLEVRVPFCDKRLVEYCYNIPVEMKFLNGNEKALLKEAMKDILPIEIVHRKKSPYPKTWSPKYYEMLVNRIREVMNEDGLFTYLVNKEVIEEMIMDDKDIMWYGQLMRKPQVLAYLLQVDMWLKEYQVMIEY